MATIDEYVLKIDAQGLEKIDKARQGMLDLKDAIAGIALGGFITSVYMMADALDDLSKSTGISIGALAGFGGALKAAGGEVENAGKIVSTFYDKIGAAADGTESAQKSFAKVGVTLDDLRNLSEEDLLRKTIDGLNEIQNPALKSAAAMDLLGKGIKGVDISGLADFKDMKEIERATKAAADAVGALEYTYKNLKQAVLIALTPISEALGKITIDLETMKVVVIAIGAALGAAFSVRLVGVIVSIGTAVAGLTAQLVTARTAAIALSASLGPLGWANIAAGIAGAGVAAYALKDTFDETAKSAEEAADASDKLNDPGPKRKILEFTEAEAEARRQAVLAARAETVALKEKLQEQVKEYNFNRELLTLRQRDADLTKISYDIQKADQQKIIDLEKAITVERTKGAKANEGVVKELKNQIAAIKETQEARISGASNVYLEKEAQDQARVTEQINITNRALLEQVKIRSALNEERIKIQIEGVENEQVQSQIALAQRLKELDAARAVEISNIIKKYEDLQLRLGSLSEQQKQDQAQEIADVKKRFQVEEQSARNLYDLNERLASQRLEVNRGIDMATRSGITERHKSELQALEQLAQGKSSIEVEYFRKNKELADKTSQAITDLNYKAINAQTQAERDYYDEKALLANDDLKKSKARLEEITRAEAAVRNSSIAGAKEAMLQIAKSSTPFVVAQNQITSVFNNMGSALDKFVDTGKLSFSELARSIIADILKIQLRAAASDFFGSLMGSFGGGGAKGGGLFGGSIIPGFLASGGPAMAGNPYIVGEQGPELFVPRTAGTVVPNSGLAGMGGSQITNTYVTNNISAVDAKSVAQLFAENRRTLLGTVEQARREFPQRA